MGGGSGGGASSGQRALEPIPDGAPAPNAKLAFATHGSGAGTGTGAGAGARERELSSAVGDLRPERNAAFYQTIFDAAHREIYHLLETDSYSRYLTSALFERLCDNIELERKMIAEAEVVRPPAVPHLQLQLQVRDSPAHAPAAAPRTPSSAPSHPIRAPLLTPKSLAPRVPPSPTANSPLSPSHIPYFALPATPTSAKPIAAANHQSITLTSVRPLTDSIKSKSP